MYNKTICHCGLNKPYNECCELFILHHKLPETAEQLMRSRFTAYKLKFFEYLIATHLPKNETPVDNISDFQSNIEWLGLNVLHSSNCAGNEDLASVEFVAFFSNTSSDPQFTSRRYQQLHEKSDFRKVDGRWLYLSGKALKPVKLSRNQLCFCNSGKKLKKCHAD